MSDYLEHPQKNFHQTQVEDFQMEITSQVISSGYDGAHQTKTLNINKIVSVAALTLALDSPPFSDVCTVASFSIFV